MAPPRHDESVKVSAAAFWQDRILYKIRQAAKLLVPSTLLLQEPLFRVFEDTFPFDGMVIEFLDPKTQVVFEDLRPLLEHDLLAAGTGSRQTLVIIFQGSWEVECKHGVIVLQVAAYGTHFLLQLQPCHQLVVHLVLQLDEELFLVCVLASPWIIQDWVGRFAYWVATLHIRGVLNQGSCFVSLWRVQYCMAPFTLFLRHRTDETAQGRYMV